MVNAVILTNSIAMYHLTSDDFSDIQIADTKLIMFSAISPLKAIKNLS